MRSHVYEWVNAIEPAPAPVFVPATACQCTGTIWIDGVEYGGKGVRNPSCPVHALHTGWIPQPATTITRTYRTQAVPHGKNGGRPVRRDSNG